MAIYIQYFNYRWFRIRINKFFNSFNKRAKGYWQNLFICKRFKWTKIWKFINRENTGIKHLNDSKAFIECSNTMDGVYENIDNYSPKRKRKILIIFDDMVADIMTNKKFQSLNNYLLDLENKIFHLYLSLNLVFLFQKM